MKREPIQKTVSVLFLFFSLMSCAQSNKELRDNNHTEETSKTSKTMDTTKITNENVKKAIEALQSGDKSWYTYFTENPVMTDDGHKVDFKNFFAKALGNEKFLTIDQIEEDGKEIYGDFRAGNWGTFRVFFKFHQNTEGKFDRLDIGQAN